MAHIQNQPHAEFHDEGFFGHLLKIFLALNLIGTGVYFFLDQSNIVEFGNNWWVMYIIIPGLTLFWGAYLLYQGEGLLSGIGRVMLVVGALFVLVAFIFMVDPNWTFFTSLFGKGSIFSFVGDWNWNAIWPLLVALLGIGLLFTGSRRRE